VNDNRVNRLAHLTPDQLKQLAGRLSARREATSASTSLAGQRRAGESVPLSYAQERLWLVEQMGLVGTAYHMSMALRLDGALDEKALERSFRELLRRHESLRTRFESVDGQARQVIDAVDFTLRRWELDAFPAEDEASVLKAFTQHAFQQPFDLARGPLFRASLLRLGEQRHALSIAMHHIVSDGWSNGILLSELTMLYQAYSRGQTSPLAEPTAQYADFALWQRRSLGGEALSVQLSYWKAKLAGAPVLLELPTDRPRPVVPSHRGGVHRMALSKPVSEALAALARSEGATLFMLLLATFQLLLSRWSGQGDVVVGTTTAGRTHPKAESLIGLFVNALPLRTRIEEGCSVLDLLRQVQETALSAYAHQDLPFEKLVKELAPSRDLSRQPIFQVLMEWRGIETSELRLGELRLQPIAGEHVTAKFDLTLVMEERADGLSGALEYASDLFDASTIERLAAHFIRLLEQVAERPQARLDQLDMLGPGEREMLLTQWNDTDAPLGQACFHDAFAAQARLTPDAPAVIEGTRQLSYEQLDRQANRLAQHLRALGVGPEVVVALCLPRGLDMMVTVLGILKAGGAYLPIDASYPTQRMAFMLEDSLAAVLVTVEALEDRLPAYRGRLVLLDYDAATIARRSEDPPAAALGPNHPAYVIYTSGSTGRPKGVVVLHGGLRNYTQWAAQTYPVEQGEGAAVTTSLSFDATVTSLFLPLLRGKATTLLPEGDEFNALSAASGQRFSLLKLPPAQLSLLNPLLTDRIDVDLARCLVLGGEALNPATVADWFARAPGSYIVNEYGPTETVVGCTYHELWPETPIKASIPIGRPIWNTQVYVLDASLRPVPVGLPGELYIGGAGLARGYLNRPALTAERFIAHPFGAPGSRLYRTGDLARWLPDGRLDYLGRVDHQVKLRGFRIELAEIESVLARHPTVAQAAAMVREDRPGQKHLVCYVVGNAGHVVDTSKLRQFLAEQLPEYMVPSAIVLLSQLPLNTNGKIDFKAMPAPGAEASSYRAPRTEVERILADLFAEFLDLERAGIDDNFFDLGGDSFASIQLVSRARKQGLILTPRDIFKHQTVAALAGSVTIDDCAPDDRAASPASCSDGSVPLLPVQRIALSLWDDEIDALVSSYCYELGRPTSALSLRQALGLLVERHDALRLKIGRTEEGQWDQRLLDVVPAPDSLCRVVDLSAMDEAQAAVLMAQQILVLHDEIDVAKGRLLQAALFEFGPGRSQRLAMVVHHFANDVVSYPILLEELHELYSHVERKTVATPFSGTSFAKWAATVAARFPSVPEGRTEFSMTVSQRLPLDRPGGHNTVASIRRLVEPLPEFDTRAMARVALAVGLKLEDLCLLALAHALQAWTGDARPSIEQLRHGREPLGATVDVSRSLGWFTTGVPMPIDLTGPRDLPSLARQVQALYARADLHGLAYWAEAANRLANGLGWEACPVCFNHQGERVTGDSPREAWLRRIASPEGGPSPVSDRARRRNVIELQTASIDGLLHATWIYSDNLHAEESVRGLARRFRAALLDIASTESLTTMKNNLEREYL